MEHEKVTESHEKRRKSAEGNKLATDISDGTVATHSATGDCKKVVEIHGRTTNRSKNDRDPEEDDS